MTKPNNVHALVYLQYDIRYDTLLMRIFNPFLDSAFAQKFKDSPEFKPLEKGLYVLHGGAYKTLTEELKDGVFKGLFIYNNAIYR